MGLWCGCAGCSDGDGGGGGGVDGGIGGGGGRGVWDVLRYCGVGVVFLDVN
ncbi:hypothetical protein E2C01_095819 [Portunus trituberculatus]|uniref:Uncharacterized protein n=1 Tax=Portunus trituberculatus TaxID=210409 RepID=A0A5B7JWC0_PORTR|nr:hypothetical protein [Portunus trituberculatus]